MILETAVLNIKSGQEAAFEAAMRQARPLIAASHGFIDMKLQRCIEAPSRYLLSVKWRTVEDHTVGFRQSDGYQKWRDLLHHFYDPMPTVEHYDNPIPL